MSADGGVSGEAHFDVTCQPEAKLEHGISAILRQAVAHPDLQGWARPAVGWDLSWARDWPRHLIVIRWHDKRIEISCELAGDVVRTGSWLVSKYIAQALLDA